MPYIPLPRKAITIDVVDKVFNDSVFKQKAVFTGLIAQISLDNNELSIIIKTRSDLYSLKDGQYGLKIEGDEQFNSKEVLLFANNNCLVYFDPQTPEEPKNGDILYYKNGGPTIDEIKWSKVNPNGTLQAGILLSEVPEPCTLQGDLFGVMMDTPMILNQLIQKHIIAANNPLFNRYA